MYKFVDSFEASHLTNEEANLLEELRSWKNEENSS